MRKIFAFGFLLVLIGILSFYAHIKSEMTQVFYEGTMGIVNLVVDQENKKIPIHYKDSKTKEALNNPPYSRFLKDLIVNDSIKIVVPKKMERRSASANLNIKLKPTKE
jgi:hypothetical protein